MKVAPRPALGFAVLAGYLVAFYAVWIVTDVDYQRVGDTVSTVARWYVAPLAAGAVVLVVAATVLGWWRPALREPAPSAPRWALVPAGLMLLAAVVSLVMKDYSGVTPALFGLVLLGSIGVGFGEEMATRGLLVVGLRGRLTEPVVWLLSCVCFGLLHLPNWVFGLGPGALGQVVIAFLAGSTFYLLRRASGTLVAAMVLHGLWDFASFIGTGSGILILSPAVGLVAFVLTLVVLRGDRGRRLPQVGEPLPAAAVPSA